MSPSRSLRNSSRFFGLRLTPSHILLTLIKQDDSKLLYLYGIYLDPLHYLHSLHSNNNHAPQVLRRLQTIRSTAGSPAPVLLCLPVRLVLFRGLSEERLEEAAQENLQASQRGAWRHAVAGFYAYVEIY
jgi:hypothetical protein